MGSSSSKNNIKDYSTTIAQSISTAINSTTNNNTQSETVCVDNTCCDCYVSNEKTICTETVSNLYAIGDAECTNSDPSMAPVPVPAEIDYGNSSDGCGTCDKYSNTTCSPSGATDCSDSVSPLPTTDSSTSPSGYNAMCLDTSDSEINPEINPRNKIRNIFKNIRGAKNNSRSQKPKKTKLRSEYTNYDECMQDKVNFLENELDTCTTVDNDLCVDGSINMDEYMYINFTDEQTNTIRTTITNSISKDLTSSIESDNNLTQLSTDVKNSITSVSCVVTQVITDDENWSNLINSQCMNVSVSGGNQGVVNMSETETAIESLVQTNSQTTDAINQLIDDVSEQTKSGLGNSTKIVIILLIVLAILVVIGVLIWLWHKYKKQKE